MMTQRICLCWLALCSYLLTVECGMFSKKLVLFLLAAPIFGQGYYGQSSYYQPLYNNNYGYQPYNPPYNHGFRLNNDIQTQRNILLNNRQSDQVNAVTPESFDETERRNNAHIFQSNRALPWLIQSRVRQDSKNRYDLDDGVLFDEKQNTKLILSVFAATSPPPVSKQSQARSVFEQSVKVLTEKTAIAPKISADITNFGLQLIRNLDAGGNTVLSTSSVAAAMALLQQGARGETQFQISIALDSGAITSATYKHIVTILEARKSKNILKYVNGIFTAASYNLNPEFRRIATQNFLAEVHTVDFNRPELAVQQINRWIGDKTDHHIKELVNLESVTYHSQMVLVNAVYFKGVWKTQFNPKSTIPMDFHLPSGQIKKTPFMRLTTYFKAGLDEEIGVQFIIIPFDGEIYSFVVLLPTPETDLNTVIRRLDAKRLTGYHKTAPKEVKLSIPKFSIRGKTNLRPVLSKMGVTNIFNHQSDLSAIVAPGQISPQISAAMHAAVLSIDEEGSIAAAATAFAAVALSSGDDTEYFRADRPFLGILWDNELKAALFMTRIEDPTSMT